MGVTTRERAVGAEAPPLAIVSDDGHPFEWHTLWPEGERSSEWSHSGVAITAGAELVFAEPGGHALIFLDERSGAARRVPTPTADCHGILTAPLFAPDSLWIADPGEVTGQVLRMDLVSGTVERIAQPDVAEPTSERWRPTSTAIVTVPGSHSGDLWIADGYGESLVHLLRADGSTATFDGSSTGTRFDCPHGIVIDDRGAEPRVVIADRNNRRLVVFDLDGDFVRTVDDPLLTSPSSLAVAGGDLLVTDLFGALLAVDEQDAVRAILALDAAPQREGWPNALRADQPVRPAVVDGRLNSPHGITVGAGGVVYLTEWFLGGRVVRLRPLAR